MDVRSDLLSGYSFRSSASASASVDRHRHQPNFGRYESTLDDSARAYRATALQQLNGAPRPLSWKNRQTNHSASRSSTLATQPVLVRAYSGGPAEDRSPPSKMSLRRSFPFTGSSRAQQRGPEIPSDEEFSIDSILRAIEPNIRGTLDSIGEICGRSKLSLANEYGSHIAPLGEIRAPPGGLVTVEEASSDNERQANDNVVIYDDENSVTDGRDHISFSHYGYFQHGRQPGMTSSHGAFHSMHPISEADVSSTQAQPLTPRSAGFNPGPDPDVDLGLPAASRESASKPRSYGRALLAKKAVSGTDQTQGILTPALVSEILLDAQADSHAVGSAPSSEPRRRSPKGHPRSRVDAVGDRESSSGESPKASVLGDVQALIGWLTQFAGYRADAGESKQTAEMRLRMTLERQNDLVSLDSN
ncbi:hypothetical protein P170DRAFT_433784 [Aspergillus steynii IBT 23096]|uniref:Uncharacterized protein n=1 Tax=Aspergillus steynii IBT 23096 TaxID=1392250 RepID=A0A2I2GG72_9EURO|nr:uncharacterized protein P170DRAFT_433784 [Aspergillus steynii IBT 23096]PLB51884.1 hypothetical protein P170DRAFT_433784 [Aspergillus steynii IBT 23096]